MSDAEADTAESTALKVAGAWIQALTDGSKEVVALLDGDGGVQYLSVSGAVQSLLGYEAMEIMGMEPRELCHPLDLERVLDGFRAVASHPGARISIEYRARHRAGHYLRVESTAVNRLRSPHIHAVVVHTRALPMMDVAPPRASNIPAPLVEDDEGLIRVLDEAIERSTGGSYQFSLIVVEIDRADELAEAYGEEVAGGVMREVGRRLDALLRPGDKLARLTDGPFAALLDGVGDRSLAARIADRIQKTVGNRFHVRGQDVFTQANIGIATSARRYERADDVLRDAILAASKARGDGAEKPALFRTQMRVQKTRHMSLTAELHNALGRNELRVHYLPIINLATRTLSGFEALARWDHPQRGIIDPELFIPVAEEAGLMMRLGRWVLLESCTQMIEWQRRYPVEPPLTLSVNVSSRQFDDLDLDDQVVGIVEDTGFAPHLLSLELGENVVLQNREMVGEAVRRLRSLGMSFHLDNFGVGASSLAALQELPYDRLKIDRSVVAKMAESRRHSELVQALVGLAHDLSMEVVAEGIETPGQAAQVSKLWCEYAQGYLFSKPLDADGAGALIASYPRWWG